MRSQYVHILAAAFGMASWLGKFYWNFNRKRVFLEFFCQFSLIFRRLKLRKTPILGKMAKLIRFHYGLWQFCNWFQQKIATLILLNAKIVFGFLILTLYSIFHLYTVVIFWAHGNPTYDLPYLI